MRKLLVTALALYGLSSSSEALVYGPFLPSPTTVVQAVGGDVLGLALTGLAVASTTAHIGYELWPEPGANVELNDPVLPLLATPHVDSYEILFQRQRAPYQVNPSPLFRWACAGVSIASTAFSLYANFAEEFHTDGCGLFLPSFLLSWAWLD